jgi:hypothetical protein
VGWLCLFCGDSIEASPIRLFAHWTNDGVDPEQWFCSHRECFVQHASSAEMFGGPLFDD